MNVNDLIERLRYEADISARPGQMDRLIAIADEFAAILADMEGRQQDKTAHKKRELVLSGDDANAPLPLKDSEINHLRRLLAWMRTEYMLDPDTQRGYLEGATEMVRLGFSSPEKAGAVVEKAATQINQVPLYVRQGVKMLTKALRDHDLDSGIVEDKHATAQEA